MRKQKQQQHISSDFGSFYMLNTYDGMYMYMIKIYVFKESSYNFQSCLIVKFNLFCFHIVKLSYFSLSPCKNKKFSF